MLKKIVLGLLVAGITVLLAPAGMRTIESITPLPATKVTKNAKFEPAVIPKKPVLEAKDEPKSYSTKKILTLEAANMVVLRGPVSDKNVSQVMQEMRAMSSKLPSKTPIYLVLDTPGGSVFAGLEFMDFVKALPNRVYTVTLFAASMGFHIAQGLDKRYILPNGTLMSHRAAVKGMSGQLNGEFEARYKMIMRSIDFLDFTAAKRLKMPLADYQEMIVNEYWVHGFDAVGEKAADEQVLVRCGKSLQGTQEVMYNTFFGPVAVSFSKCPLIRAPLKVDASQVKLENQSYVNHVFHKAFNARVDFVKEFILTDKFSTVFK